MQGRNYLRYDVPVTHSHLDHKKWSGMNWLMHKFFIGSRSALLVDMPRKQSPGRDICIFFVSSPPLSQSDHACCISPGTKDAWHVHSCYLHLCIFLCLYFCISYSSLCIVSSQGQHGFAFLSFTFLLFSSWNISCKVVSVSEKQKLESNFSE